MRSTRFALLGGFLFLLGAGQEAVRDLPVSLSEEPDFSWPRPLPSFPRMEDALLEPTVTSEEVRTWQERLERRRAVELGEVFIRSSELLLDRLLEAAVRLVPKADETVHARILEFRPEPRVRPVFEEFLDQWARRERRILSRFEDTRVSTVGFDAGTEDADSGELAGDQGKVLWDALRDTYFSKFRSRPEDRIREDAFYLDRWRGFDYAVLPPVIAAYLWLRGLDRRFSAGGTSLRVILEPLSRWERTDEDLVAGAGLEWAPTRRFPVALLVSAGLYDGDPEVDFVGVGTSLGMARKSIELER
jgi:hypothetical protein